MIRCGKAQLQVISGEEELLARVALAVAFLVIGSVVPASAESKLALVIGNGHYQNVGVLRNPVSDADLISTTLKQIGFKVTDKRDLNSTELRAAIIDFLNAAEQAGPETITLL